MEPSEIARYCSHALEQLRTSPTFAMSLGARELFHTNFLAFLLESEDDALDPVRRALRQVFGIETRGDEISSCAVWREKHHLDLIVVPRHLKVDETDEKELGNRAVIIEAKLKSIPAEQQLRDYEVRLHSGFTLSYPENDSPSDSIHISTQDGYCRPQLVLLSPKKPAMATDDSWKPLTWNTVASAIRGALEKIENTTKLSMILVDYADSLDSLVCIIQSGHNYFEDVLRNQAQITYSSLLATTTAPDFRRLRLHDLVSKSVFDRWAHAEGSSLKQLPLASQLRLDYYVHFSNSQPGISFEISLPMPTKSVSTAKQDQRLKVGIQIQGGNLRRTISSVLPEPDLEQFILGSPLLRGWLTAKTFSTEDPVGSRGVAIDMSLSKSNGRFTNLCVFDVKRFIYSYVPLTGKMLSEVNREIQTAMMCAISICATLAEDEIAIVR